MSALNPPKPIGCDPKLPDVGLLNQLALGLLLELNGGSMTFDLDNIQRMAAMTDGIDTKVMTSKEVGKTYVILQLREKQTEKSLIIH